MARVSSMRADKILTVMAAAVATAAMALAAKPSGAQAPPAPGHPPARVTVHKRPSVDPIISENRRRGRYYDLFSHE